MNDAKREYMRAYYEANKEHIKARMKQTRKKRPRTAATLQIEARYRAKKRAIAEIEQMQFGVSPFDAVKGGE